MRERFAGRRWILATDVLQAASGTADRLQAWGASGCLVIAARMGTGPVPAVEHHVLGLPPAPMMVAIHAAEDALRRLPDAVQDAVDAFDPAHEASVLGSIFSDGRPVAGRAFFGRRPAAWRDLEDKVVIDALWDAVGIPRAPREIVAVELAALTEAAARLDRGSGTVWAGDASQGFHGGASYTRWVRDPADAAAAAAHLATRCTTARVMPFLRGVPCSIHGLVLPADVLAFRPAEMVILTGPGGFTYGRAATFWDPPDEVRTAMRSTAMRVGRHLQRTLGYRGVFTIDGIATADGFLPTELNPRVGAAVAMMCPELPFPLLHSLLVEGIDPDVDPAALQDAILEHADRHRAGSAAFLVDVVVSETTHHPLTFQDGVWDDAVEGEPADGLAILGPGVTGGYAMLRLDPHRTPIGEAVAPRAAAFAAWVDRRLGSTLGDLRPAWQG